MNDKAGKHEAQAVDDDIDALFKLPLAEFTTARKALAARLKKAERAADAERVRALAKPPVSAWAVNQIYWRHRDAFHKLMDSGERLAQAHAAQLAGKPADTVAAGTARREALSALVRFAEEVLRDAGHGAASTTLNRVTSTLEAISFNGLAPIAQPPGRLTSDMDPPGFGSFSALIPNPSLPVSTEPTASAETSAPSRRNTDEGSLKSALEDADRALHAARARSQEFSKALTQASERVDRALRERQEAQKHFNAVKEAADLAEQQLRTVTIEAEDAARALEAAERRVEEARSALEKRNR